MKAKTFLPAMISMSMALAASQSASRADDDVTRTEKQFQEIAASYPRNSSPYSSQLLYLARVYQENGKRSKADDTFRDLLAMDKQGSDAAVKVPELLQYWATILATERHHFSFPGGTSQEEQTRVIVQDKTLHVADLKKSEQLLRQAVVMLDALPSHNLSRLVAHRNLFEFLRQHEKPEEADIELANLNGLLVQSEKMQLARNEALNVSRMLELLSTEYVPGISRFHHGDPKPRLMATEQQIETADALRLRALAIRDRLLVGDSERTMGHRNQALWYEMLSRDNAAAAQNELLAKLIGSHAPEVLHPRPMPCYGCGMG